MVRTARLRTPMAGRRLSTRRLRRRRSTRLVVYPSWSTRGRTRWLFRFRLRRSHRCVGNVPSVLADGCLTLVLFVQPIACVPVIPTLSARVETSSPPSYSDAMMLQCRVDCSELIPLESVDVNGLTNLTLLSVQRAAEAVRLVAQLTERVEGWSAQRTLDQTTVDSARNRLRAKVQLAVAHRLEEARVVEMVDEEIVESASEGTEEEIASAEEYWLSRTRDIIAKITQVIQDIGLIHRDNGTKARINKYKFKPKQKGLRRKHMLAQTDNNGRSGEDFKHSGDSMPIRESPDPSNTPCTPTHHDTDYHASPASRPSTPRSLTRTHNGPEDPLPPLSTSSEPAVTCRRDDNVDRTSHRILVVLLLLGPLHHLTNWGRTPGRGWRERNALILAVAKGRLGTCKGDRCNRPRDIGVRNIGREMPGKVPNVPKQSERSHHSDCSR
jgi:hypothetical protein